MAIVVGLVENRLGEAALAHAVEEARLRGDRVILVSHVWEPRASEADRTEDFEAERRRVEGLLEGRAEKVRADGVACEAYVPPTPRSPANAILSAADEVGADLIVVGIRRRSPVGKAVLGSVAQDVLLGAECAVLGVKADE